LVSQLNNISSLIFAFIPIGSLGLTKYIAEYYNDDKKYELGNIIVYFLLRNIPIAIIFSFSLFFFADYISEFIFDDNKYSGLLMIFSVSIPLGLITSFMDIYLKGIRKIGLYVKFIAFSSLASLIIYFPLLIAFKLEGAVLTVVITTGVNIVIGALILHRNDLLFFLKKIRHVKIKNEIKKDVVKIGLAAMVMLAIQQISFLLVKSLMADKLGIYNVGIYHSVFSISNSYFALFFSVIGAYSIPKLSTLKKNDEIISEINQVLKLLLFLYTPLIVICYVFRIIIILTLYSEEFLVSNSLFFYQLSGDFFRALSWVFGLWLIPNLKIKQWLIFDLFNSFFFTIASFLLIDYFHSLESFTVAYFLTHFFQTIIQFTYIKYSLSFKFILNNLKILLTSILLIVFVFFLSKYNVLWGYYIILPSLLIWFFIAIKKNDIASLKLLISDIRKKR
jgi:O-antigen/teichoic acid export membrane protein